MQKSANDSRKQSESKVQKISEEIHKSVDLIRDSKSDKENKRLEKRINRGKVRDFNVILPDKRQINKLKVRDLVKITNREKVIEDQKKVHKSVIVLRAKDKRAKSFVKTESKKDKLIKTLSPSKCDEIDLSLENKINLSGTLNRIRENNNKIIDINQESASDSLKSDFLHELELERSDKENLTLNSSEETIILDENNKSTLKLGKSVDEIIGAQTKVQSNKDVNISTDFSDRLEINKKNSLTINNDIRDYLICKESEYNISISVVANIDSTFNEI